MSIWASPSFRALWILVFGCSIFRGCHSEQAHNKDLATVLFLMLFLMQPGLKFVPSGLQNCSMDHRVTTGQNKMFLLRKVILFVLYKKTVLLVSNKSDSDVKVNFTLYLVILYNDERWKQANVFTCLCLLLKSLTNLTNFNKTFRKW